MKYKISLTLFYFLFAIFMMSISRFGFEMYFNNIGSLFLFLIMILDIRTDTLGKKGFLGLIIFSVFHSIGACYLYSYVPYNDWILSLFNFDINEYFSFTRNHYDRLVHFLFGLLLFPSIKDLLIKYNFSPVNLLFVTFLSIQTFSMIYELFEWLISILFTEGVAESYNGQQGDMWDAHKDMALAMLGSIFAWIFSKK